MSFAARLRLICCGVGRHCRIRRRRGRRRSQCAALERVIVPAAIVADDLGIGGEHILAVLAEAEHVADALQQTALLLVAVLVFAIVERRLEWPAIGEATVLVGTVDAILEQPVFARL